MTDKAPPRRQPLSGGAATPGAPRVQVLAAGTFRDMHGTPVTIGTELMRELADSYDPALYAAPVVLGHPQHNHPRFGTVTDPRASADTLEVGLAQLDPDFIAAHRAGHYPQRSLSFWPAGHPDNPLPTKDRAYIRHLGFLGAKPPAIKGLRGADLTDPDSEPGVISIALAHPDPLHLEEQTMPEQTAAEQTAHQPPSQPASKPQPPQNPAPPAPGPQVADLAEREAKLSTQAAELAAREAQILAREQALHSQEAERRRQAVTSFAEGLADQAKLRPVDVPRITEILLALDEHASAPALCFAETGDDGTLKQQSAGDWLRGHLAAREPLVELGETATSANAAPQASKGKSDSQIAREARAYRDRQLAAGITISLAEAVDAVEAGTAE